MINLRRKYGLIFCSLNLEINHQNFSLDNVMIDTGCASTILNSDFVPLDGSEEITFAFGVGGRETILDKNISNFKVNEFIVNKSKVNLGEVDYGIDIDCILGLDVLDHLNAIISLDSMTLEFKVSNEM